MKRILVLTLALLLFAVPAVGEELDLSGMELGELVSLRERADAEITSRIGFSDEQIGSGYYIVGEDIKPGKYELICTLPDIIENSDGTNRSRCGLVVAASKADDAEALFDYGAISLGQQILITLEEGNVLAIVRGNFDIRPFDHSWAP